MRYLTICLFVAMTLAGCVHLDQPTDVRAIAISDTSVMVTWKDWAKWEEGYLIQEMHGRMSFATTSRTFADSQRAVINGRVPGETYLYRVVAFKGEEQGPFSQTVEVTLPRVAPSAVTPVEAPMGLTTTAYSVSEIQLAWVDCAEKELGFEIERRETPDGTWLKVGDVGSNIIQFRDRGLKPGTRHYYRVRSIGVNGPSDYSNQSSTITPLTKNIRVIYPNGGEVINGPELIIRYEADPTIGGVKIYFFNDSNFWFVARAWTENNGVYVFRDFSSLVSSKKYKIRIATSDPALYDESDGFFEINSDTR